MFSDVICSRWYAEKIPHFPSPSPSKASTSNQIANSALSNSSESNIKIETNSETINIDISDKENCELWIFGYGSLVWRPNFEYNLKLVGSIKGFKRRFWQGNTFHRGTKSQVARVATLIPQSAESSDKSMIEKTKDPFDEEETDLTIEQIYTTYGVGFQLKGKEQILGAVKHLNVRETKLGGYDVVLTRFHPIMSVNKEIKCLVFMATIESPIYLGPKSSSQIADQICAATGACGTNVEYLFKLCQWHKSNVPHIKDNHICNIETHCLYIIRDKIHQQENISRSITPVKDKTPETDWLMEPWVKSYVELCKMTSGIKCTCHDSPAKDPAEFFGQFGPHYS